MDQLFKIYANQKEDIWRCPKQGCPYLGIYDPKCKDDVSCTLCKFKWVEESSSDLNKNTWFIQKLKSYFEEILKSEKCPNCGVTILKNGGCPHILCLKCNFEFCWLCLGSYPSYMHIERTFCPLRLFVFWLMLVFSLVFINFKLVYTFDSVCFYEKFAIYYGSLAILMNLYLYILIYTTWLLILEIF